MVKPVLSHAVCEHRRVKESEIAVSHAIVYNLYIVILCENGVESEITAFHPRGLLWGYRVFWREGYCSQNHKHSI
jgi:hypothetical protein